MVQLGFTFKNVKMPKFGEIALVACCNKVYTHSEDSQTLPIPAVSPRRYMVFESCVIFLTIS